MSEGESVPQALQNDLDAFSRECAAIVDPFVKSMEKCAPPTDLWHYTSSAGLFGILESGKLWLTDIFELNDPSELQHGLSFAEKILKKCADEGTPEGKLVYKQFQGFVEKVLIKQIARFFVCSFSSCGDDLGRWRAYADNGRGYVLCFDTTALEEAFTKKTTGLMKNNITYPLDYSDSLADMHQRIVEQLFRAVSAIEGSASSVDVKVGSMRRLYSLFMQEVIYTSAFFKHEAYSGENEYRFLQMFSVNDEPKVRERCRGYSFVPYRTFNWRSAQVETLKKIIVGPAANKVTAKRFVDECLRKFHCAYVDVESSTIPYTAL